MSLRPLALLPLLILPAQAQGPRFTVRDAIQAEWARQPLPWTEAQKAALPPGDRIRLERSLQRIGAPGSPPLLPPALEHPSREAWEAQAQSARTAQERFTALFMLNRLKSPRALTALEGLTAADAATWPKHLHLEASIASARLNGAEAPPPLTFFLGALQKAGKGDPVRAQAARLRLVMAGMEKGLLPPVPATPGSVLALMDAWNRAPWEARGKQHAALFSQWMSQIESPLALARVFNMSKAFRALGLDDISRFALTRGTEGLTQRLIEGLPNPLPPELAPGLFLAMSMPNPRILGVAAAKLGGIQDANLIPLASRALSLQLSHELDGLLRGGELAPLRRLLPEHADHARCRHLFGPSPIARAAAIEDLPSPPLDLAAITRITWKDVDFDAQQTLIRSYARWKLAPEEQKTELRPWLLHPDWACRWEAYQALVKLDPGTPWPAAPRPSPTDQKILHEAIRLAEKGGPVRLRLTLSGQRRLTLRLDPTVAPMNVANLMLLAKRGFFDGRRVARVVPDFVVQMGSPCDTMDGGPGYTVRCENSTDWYGPGSVGMALSGKDTGGSQFFITTNATPHLTGRYTRVGEVEDLDRALRILDDLELGARILSVQVMEH